MPLYDYRCADCNHTVETRHGFDDTYSEVCPKCGGRMNRVFNPAPIVFKGSGFYINDSRSKSGSSNTSASADSKPTGTTESKPSATETPKSDTSKTDTPKSDSAKSDKPKAGSNDSAA